MFESTFVSSSDRQFGHIPNSLVNIQVLAASIPILAASKGKKIRRFCAAKVLS